MGKKKPGVKYTTGMGIYLGGWVYTADYIFFLYTINKICNGGTHV